MLWILFAALGAACAACLLHCVQRRDGKNTIKPLPTAAAAVLLVLMLDVGLAASGIGRIIGLGAGDPGEAAEAFFAAVETGDFETAGGYLEYHTDLGLSDVPTEDSARLVYDALIDSYGYCIQSDAVVHGVFAEQTVELTHLDVEALHGDMDAAIETALVQMIDENRKDAIFDEGEQYLPGVLEQAYATALETLLTDSASYVVTDTVTVQLTWTPGGWKIAAEPGLLNALSGFRAY